MFGILWVHTFFMKIIIYHGMVVRKIVFGHSSSYHSIKQHGAGKIVAELLVTENCLN